MKKPKVQILMPSALWKPPVAPQGTPTYEQRIALLDQILVKLPKVSA